MSELSHPSPSENTTPKGRKVSYTKNVKDKNIIEKIVTDSRKLKGVFKSYPMLPYAGTNDASGDSLLNFFYSLSYLSGTDGTTIKNISDYVVGDGLEVTYIDDEFIDDEKRVLDAGLRSKFKDFRKSINVVDGDLIKLGINLFVDRRITGNFYIMISKVTTLGETSYKVESVKQRDCRILLDINRKPTDLYVISDNIQDESYLKEKTPKFAATFPNYLEDSLGVSRSLIHVKNGNDPYGRPGTMDVTMHKYSEFQAVLYRIQQADDKFTGELIIEAEQGDPNTNPMLDRQTYDNVFTQKADNPLSVFYTERPPNAKELFVYQIKPNSSQDYWKVTGDIDEEKIIASHQWSKRLNGKPVAGGISDNDFIGEIRAKLPMIIRERKEIVMAINHVFQQIAFERGLSELQEVGINYRSNILDKIAEIGFIITNKNQNQSSNDTNKE